VGDWSPQRERRAASARSEEGGWASHLYWLQREEMGQDGLGHDSRERREGIWMAQRICVGRSGVGVGNWGLGVGAPPVLASRPRDRGSAGCDASLRGSCLLSLHASLTGLHLGQQCVHIAGPL
jgi:hypothetical protein